jgi:hypothetical protein
MINSWERERAAIYAIHVRRFHARCVYALIMGARKLHPDDSAMHGLRSVMESALKYTIACYVHTT